MIRKTLFRVVMVAAMAAPMTGCAAAALAGAGAGAGIYLTSQGAEGVASEPVGTVAARARSVMQAEGIQLTDTETEENGTEMEYHGMRGDMEVHVKLESRDGGGTMVRASARTGTAEWDKEYARTLVQRITGG